VLKNFNEEKLDGIFNAEQSKQEGIIEYYIYWNREGTEAFKARGNTRIGRTSSKYPIRNSCNTRNKMVWQRSNKKK